MQTLRDVHLLVLDGFADWEPALATAAKPVRSLGGLTVVPDLELFALSPVESAMLILPGADAWAGPGMEPTLDVVRSFAESSVPIAAICGATFGLARAGLLDDRRHTSNDPSYLASSGDRGSALYLREPAVEDRGFITASATASLEFARLILGRLEVFPPRALDAWYSLFKTGAPASYYAFMEALGHASAS